MGAWGGGGEVYLARISATTATTLLRDSSFQISSGFSCPPARECTIRVGSGSALSGRGQQQAPTSHPYADTPSNIVTLASALSRIASVKIIGKNLERMMRTWSGLASAHKRVSERYTRVYRARNGGLHTRGPLSLSAIILPKRAATASRTGAAGELQNKSSR